jgi:hypothetical protein
MDLYIIPGACSLAVNIALRESGVEQWSNLARYHANIALRPAVRAALQSEGLLQ